MNRFIIQLNDSICIFTVYKKKIESKEKTPCKKCEFWIPEINKVGNSYCYELNFILRDLPEKCLHFSESKSLIL